MCTRLGVCHIIETAALLGTSTTLSLTLLPYCFQRKIHTFWRICSQIASHFNKIDACQYRDTFQLISDDRKPLM